MIKLIWWLIIGGCRHTWVNILDGFIVHEGDNRGRYYHMRCSKCGNMKHKKFFG